MLHFDTLQWTVIVASAFMTGFSKAGIMGAGTLVVPALAMVMPAKESVGFLLPMLIIGDIAASFFWYRHVDWRRLFILLPWTIVGVFGGYLLMGRITDRALLAVIGLIVLLLVVLHLWQQRLSGDLVASLPRSRTFAASMGVASGATSMLANAAGPILVLYFLVMGLDKQRFIGTAAFFFLILNCAKIPFNIGLNLVTVPSVLANLAMAPIIIVGAAAGAAVVHHIPQKLFDLVMQIMTALIGCWLCVRALL